MRRGALHVNVDGKALPSAMAMIFDPFSALGLAHVGASLLGGREAAVDECFP